MATTHENQHFENLVFSIEQFPRKSEFISCRFNSCMFSEADLTGMKFEDCLFTACDLSLSKLKQCSLQKVRFRDVKLLGLHFEQCNPFGLALSFYECQLDHASFYKTRMNKTLFKNCQLRETDFTECDLSESVFENCDLSGAIFYQSKLELTDFRTAENFSIDPEKNIMRHARFSLPSVTGLLDKYELYFE